jgi:hypothetical protein
LGASTVCLRCTGRIAHENPPDDLLSKHYLPRPMLKPTSLAVGRCELLSARAMSGIVAAAPDSLRRLERLSALAAGIYNFPLDTELLQHGSSQERQTQAVTSVASASTGCARARCCRGPLPEKDRARGPAIGGSDSPADGRAWRVSDRVWHRGTLPR